MCFELLKLLQPDKKIEDFKNAFCNLALPFISFSEPLAAPKKQAALASHRAWHGACVAQCMVTLHGALHSALHPAVRMVRCVVQVAL